MSKLKQTLIELDEQWVTRLLKRSRDLTDDEYVWEPFTGCSSIRDRGDGRWLAEWGQSDPEAAPVTTIAARLWHIGARPWPVPPVTTVQEAVRRQFVEDYAPAGHSARESCDCAADAIASIEQQWIERRAIFDAVSDDELLSPLGSDAGIYADACWFDLQLHFLDEWIHHSAEVALMRDFYRAGAIAAATPGRHREYEG